jgi:hypothetical protein
LRRQAIQFSYLGYRKLSERRSPKSKVVTAPAQAVVTKSTAMQLTAPTPVPRPTGIPYDFHPEKYERGRRHARLAYLLLFVLATPPFIVNPSSLVVALTGITRPIMFATIAFEALYWDRFEGVVFTGFLLILGAVVLVLYVLIVVAIGFGIGALIGLVRGTPVLELDAVDFRIIAAWLLLYIWFMQEYLSA